MTARTCPGLPADWLNGWLAALGALTRAPALHLRWSDDPVPLAVLVAPGDDDPADLIEAAWPTEAEVAALPIARHLDGQPELTLNPDVPTWIERARLARTDPAGWTLSSLHTDLTWDAKARDHVIERGQLHTPMPGRDNTLHDRVRKLVDLSSPNRIPSTLDGAAQRVSNYGLGFDVSRISSMADKAGQLVDPAIEILAMWGLSLLPSRGDGVWRHQRGWTTKGSDRFTWFTWDSELDRAAVDALLDVAHAGSGAPVGLTGAWECVPYEARGGSDVTRGFGSRRVAGPWDPT